MNRKRRLALLFLALIVVIPILNIAVGTVRSSVWDGQRHINIVLDNGDLALWSIEPKEKTATVVVIPKNVYLAVSPYGTYRAAAIGKLSLLEKKDGMLLRYAIEESLAVPIDATVVRKEGVEDVLDPREFFGIAFLSAIGKSSWQGRATNLTALDIIRLWLFSFSLKKELIETIDLASLDTITKTTLPDGTEGFLLDKERFSRLLANYFLDKEIAKEHLAIEIVNATEKQGAANDLALLLTNIGSSVVSTAKSEAREPQAVVFTNEKSYTASKVAKLTSAKLVFGVPKESRADILVVLGGNR